MRKTRKIYRNAKSAARPRQSNTKNVKTSSMRLLQRMKGAIAKSTRANRRRFFGGLGPNDEVIELGEEDRINDADYTQNQSNIHLNILLHAIKTTTELYPIEESLKKMYTTIQTPEFKEIKSSGANSVVYEELKTKGIEVMEMDLGYIEEGVVLFLPFINEFGKIIMQMEYFYSLNGFDLSKEDEFALNVFSIIFVSHLGMNLIMGNILPIGNILSVKGGGSMNYRKTKKLRKKKQKGGMPLLFVALIVASMMSVAGAAQVSDLDAQFRAECKAEGVEDKVCNKDDWSRLECWGNGGEAVREMRGCIVRKANANVQKLDAGFNQKISDGASNATIITAIGVAVTAVIGYAGRARITSNAEKKKKTVFEESKEKNQDRIKSKEKEIREKKNNVKYLKNQEVIETNPEKKEEIKEKIVSVENKIQRLEEDIDNLLEKRTQQELQAIEDEEESNLEKVKGAVEVVNVVLGAGGDVFGALTDKSNARVQLKIQHAKIDQNVGIERINAESIREARRNNRQVGAFSQVAGVAVGAAAAVCGVDPATATALGGAVHKSLGAALTHEAEIFTSDNELSKTVSKVSNAIVEKKGTVNPVSTVVVEAFSQIQKAQKARNATRRPLLKTEINDIRNKMTRINMYINEKGKDYNSKQVKEFLEDIKQQEDSIKSTYNLDEDAYVRLLQEGTDTDWLKNWVADAKLLKKRPIDTPTQGKGKEKTGKKGKEKTVKKGNEKTGKKGNEKTVEKVGDDEDNTEEVGAPSLSEEEQAELEKLAQGLEEEEEEEEE